MLFVTRGPTAAETIDASARVAPLAEKSGNVTLLQGSVMVEGLYSLLLGQTLRAAAQMLETQALELALRAGSPRCSGHSLRIDADLDAVTPAWRPRRCRGAFLGWARIFRGPRPRGSPLAAPPLANLRVRQVFRMRGCLDGLTSPASEARRMVSHCRGPRTTHSMWGHYQPYGCRIDSLGTAGIQPCASQGVSDTVDRALRETSIWAFYRGVLGVSSGRRSRS